MKWRRFIHFTTTLAALLIPGTSPAVSLYFDTSAANGLNAGAATWDVGTTSVWATSPVPGTEAPGVWSNGSDAFFETGGVNTITISGAVSASSVTQSVISSGTATTIGGGTLQISVGGLTNTTISNSALIINSALTLADSTVFINTGTSSAGITIGGLIDDGGNGRGILKGDTGTLTLSKANTYSGLTTVNAGSVALSGYDASVANSVVKVSGGGSLSVNSNSGTAVGSVTRAAGVTLNGGRLNVTGVAAANTSDVISGALTIGSGSANSVGFGSQINLNFATGRNTRLTFNSLAHTAGGVLVINNTSSNLGLSTIASQTPSIYLHKFVS